MASGPLFAALASRTLDHQEAARSGRRRLRRLAARLGRLAARPHGFRSQPGPEADWRVRPRQSSFRRASVFHRQPPP